MDKCISCEAKGVDREGFTLDIDELPLCADCREDYLLEIETFYDEDDY